MSLSYRQALQAAVAVAIAGTLALVLNLDYPYWAVITAGVVIMPSWGEGLRKASQRVLGTVLGCTAGLLVAWLLPDIQGEGPLALLALVMAAYHFGANYTLVMFWISLFIILLFSILGELSTASFLARLYDTLIGATVATGVSVTLLPTHSRTRFREAARQYFHDVRDAFHEAFQLGIMDKVPDVLPRPDLHETAEQHAPATMLNELPQQRKLLIAGFLQLQEAHKQSLYEGVFTRFSRRRSQRTVEELQALAQYVTDFIFAVHEGKLLRPAAPYREELSRIHHFVLASFNHVQALANQRGTTPPDDSAVDTLRIALRDHALARLQDNSMKPEEALQLIAAIDFLWQILATLEELGETLKGA